MGGVRLTSVQRPYEKESSREKVTLPDDTIGILSNAEIRTALEALSKPELLRLTKIAARMVGGTRFTSDELVQEAIYRALKEKGGRKCPRDVPFLKFLANVMRSVASADRKTTAIDPITQADRSASITTEDQASRVPDGRKTPEDVLIDADEYEKCVKSLQDLFVDDSECLLIVMGDLDGLQAEEVREMGGMDEKTWNTARRRMRRKIDKLCPEGWKI